MSRNDYKIDCSLHAVPCRKLLAAIGGEPERGKQQPNLEADTFIDSNAIPEGYRIKRNERRRLQNLTKLVYSVFL